MKRTKRRSPDAAKSGSSGVQRTIVDPTRGRHPLFAAAHQPPAAQADDAFWTVYVTAPPLDPKARRRRLLLVRISCVVVLCVCATIPIAVAVYRARIECLVDTHCQSVQQWLLRRRPDGTASNGGLRLKYWNASSILMIVAHPNDEVTWGGQFLLEHGRETHVVVTSTEQGPESAVPTQMLSDEFRKSAELLQFRGEFLWGRAIAPAGAASAASSAASGGKGGPGWTLERSLQRRIRARLCDQRWERIVTHGLEGEFGNVQHHAVHDAVLDAVHYCCNSTDRLFVFQPDPFTEPDPFMAWGASSVYGSEEKERLVEVSYNTTTQLSSGVDTELRRFGNWTESIVPYGEYDVELAERVCRAYSYSVPGGGRGGGRGGDVVDTCRISVAEVEDGSGGVPAGGAGGRGGGRVSGASLSSDSSELFGEKRKFLARGRGC